MTRVGQASVQISQFLVHFVHIGIFPQTKRYIETWCEGDIKDREKDRHIFTFKCHSVIFRTEDNLQCNATLIVSFLFLLLRLFMSNLCQNGNPTCYTDKSTCFPCSNAPCKSRSKLLSHIKMYIMKASLWKLCHPPSFFLPSLSFMSLSHIYSSYRGGGIPVQLETSHCNKLKRHVIGWQGGWAMREKPYR